MWFPCVSSSFPYFRMRKKRGKQWHQKIQDNHSVVKTTFTVHMSIKLAVHTHTERETLGISPRHVIKIYCLAPIDIIWLENIPWDAVHITSLTLFNFCSHNISSSWSDAIHLTGHESVATVNKRNTHLLSLAFWYLATSWCDQCRYIAILESL